ncbi:MAG TPA: pyrroloquinoline-quinone synthase PqqC [Myxococcota bacterium]|nr:pyrroloquinoline-quinone synthase PqqC [Myxococcota bacterium]
MSPEELERRLRAVGAERYHDKHPFHLRMHEGRLAPEEIRLWVRNRYYYQTRIPVKDGLILAKSEDAAFRREWVGRIHDHDGRAPGEGGLELWLALADAVGLDRRRVEDLSGVLPGVRAACDDYVRLVESNDLLASVASSLTELFAGDIMRTRIEAFERHYPWVDTAGLRYFRSRTVQAPKDARFGLAFVLANATSPDDQARCIAALERKCEILWRLLDAVEAAGRKPRLSPHAALRTDAPDGGRPDDAALVVLPERAVRLNASGAEILALCDGARSAASIAETLRDRHPDVAHVEPDVHAFLEQMERLGVLESLR